MDNRLTIDISGQLCHPLATMLVDADKCYDRINGIIMSLLLLAIVGFIGLVVAMLHPIQSMKFLSVSSERGFVDIHGREGSGQPTAGAIPRQWSCSHLLVDHLFHFDALLSAQRIQILNNFSNQRPHD
jgi:hypothetical protein